MIPARVMVVALAAGLASPANADCIDWGTDLEVCSTPELTVAYNDFGFPTAEIRTDRRLTQLFWTVAGPRIESEGDVETTFWTVWSLVANRLESRGHLDFNRDRTYEINGQTVYGNPFILRPEGNSNSFYVHLAVFEAHGIPVALEIIEPVFNYDREATSGLIAQAMDMIQPQGTGQ